MQYSGHTMNGRFTTVFITQAEVYTLLNINGGLLHDNTPEGYLIG